MRNRRRFLSEINLTPLLDVLFSILFIVMMAGAQNEQIIESQNRIQVNQLEQENAKLKDELARSENEISSYKTYQSEAVIITVNNIMRSNNHYLMFYKGTEETELGSIQMGVNKTENTKARIESLIMELVNETDNQPIYIVFYCNRKNIYTIEYHAVCDILNDLQGNNKEVFFKVMQAEEK